MNGIPDRRLVVNHNRLLRSYKGCIGVKTGFTKKCGRCLVSAAERDGITLVAVTLNAPDDWSDHKNMLDHAFSLYSTVEVAGEGSVSRVIPVVGGNAKSISVKNTESLTLTVRDVTKLQTKVIAPRFVYAPILSKDQPIAKIVYTVDGREVASLPLYPQQKVDVRKKESVLKRLFNIFR